MWLYIKISFCTPEGIQPSPITDHGNGLMWWEYRQGPSMLSSQGWPVRLDKADISVRNPGIPGSSILELKPISVSYLIDNIRKWTELLSLSIFIFKIGLLMPPLENKGCVMHSKCFCCECCIFYQIIVSTTQPSNPQAQLYGNLLALHILSPLPLF